LSTERLFLVDPYDEDHKKLIDNFEKDNNIQTNVSTYIKKIESSTREEYKKIKKISNEINEALFIESSNKIKDLCFISGEKDISTCTISFALLKTKLRTRKLLDQAVDFAKNTLNMKEIFIKANKNDKSILESLEKENFENLGIQDGYILYLTEAEEKKENQRKIAWKF